MPEHERLRRLTILMAEDDSDDRFLMEQVLLDLEISADLYFFEDGEELMHYLRGSEKYADAKGFAPPSLILLDLNMPRKDGREALVEIKADSDLQRIPVVVWTTSENVEDKMYCLKAGADIYMTKPSRYSELVDSISKLFMDYASEKESMGG
jgi:two-component system response regulator